MRKAKRKYWYPISVSIEIKLRKLQKRIDNFYKRNYLYVLFVVLLPSLLLGAFSMYREYSLIENYAHFEALNQGIYSTWDTSGSPGQDPPPFETNVYNIKRF